MKDDIKIDPNNKPTPQFRGPQSAPPKTVDGISPNPGSGSVVDQQPKSQAAPATEATVEAPQEPAKNNQPDSSQPPPAPKKPKKKRYILPAAIAIIILLALSSLAVYIGLIKSDEQVNTDQNANTQQKSQEQISEDNQAIEETLKEIEGLPEDQDTTGDNLADDKLGL